MKYSEQLIVERALAEYTNSTAAFPLDKNDCALLVIDMQDEFCKTGVDILMDSGSHRQVPKIKKVIEVCREQGVPVMYNGLQQNACVPRQTQIRAFNAEQICRFRI